VLGDRILESRRKAGSIAVAQLWRWVHGLIMRPELCETNIMPVAKAGQVVETATPGLPANLIGAGVLF